MLVAGILDGGVVVIVVDIVVGGLVVVLVEVAAVVAVVVAINLVVVVLFVVVGVDVAVAVVVGDNALMAPMAHTANTTRKEKCIFVFSFFDFLLRFSFEMRLRF